MTKVGNRKASLLYDDHQDTMSMPTVQASITQQTPINNTQKLSIDDMDMIALDTRFDNQMMIGSPMYIRNDESEQPLEIIKTKKDCESTSIPKEASNLQLEETENDSNAFQKIKSLRAKYILSSVQDSKSNIKNNLDEWFLYPKPLPKFWRLEKDKRFYKYTTETGGDENSETRYALEKGYYYPLDEDREFYASTAPEVLPSSNSKDITPFSNEKYTGQYFDINHYKEKYDKHVELHKAEALDWTPDDIPSFTDFKKDFEFLVKTIQSPVLNEISEKRLDYLLDKFELFQHLKSKTEILENKRVPYRDFYNCRKVDRNFLLSGCVHRRQLCDFIWEKINNEPDRIVHKLKSGKEISLLNIFEFGCDPQENPSAVGLKVIDDEFLEWYQNIYLGNYHLRPSDEAEKQFKGKQLKFYLLAKVFLEFDNYMEGEYLAEIFIKYVINHLETNKYLLTQISVDFQFHKLEEKSWWERFSNWIMKWRLVSYNVRWNVRISRIYTDLFNIGRVHTFENFLDIIFKPLFNKTLGNDIQLQYFLANICSLDLVVENTDAYIWKEFTEVCTKPSEWSAQGDNPPVAYYMYYIFEHLSKLNSIRHCQKQSTITLRSGCPSAKSRTSQFGRTLFFNDQVESLVCNLLLCNGGLLQGQPVWTAPAPLQYLFYLFQIPVISSPLSSVSTIATEINPLSTEFDMNLISNHQPSRDITTIEKRTYRKNPFMKMFQLGMPVSLSCKSLLFNNSYTSEPIIEEYSVAASIYLLNAADLCELTRTSVLCSGYDGWYKKHWIGVTISPTQFVKESIGYIDNWYDISDSINDFGTAIRHNVPRTRRIYRIETLLQEWDFIEEQYSYCF
ncbi:hypothetical protein Kpol_1027p9 [Vanderwaltozyma polyspora DSM 70294]|uniref:Inactive deaminase YJL070C n=1 Tax=Vanderwaltozyma polyspora (strain ATCC 22028 / DSM 70294 / BCRC 21397 / CBS 2163 / NBRC 10782 / NRRL Y-8283 / UCD 57-17) TaxID=436907 RepID=A7TQL4_VANPO|nr:uncharacterized protein Kpol_1027p9 [Vanderwaltozyma polyspora DSM 70294]EDO15435.1 hypothetical protein Kpol_1027p9 [Vanderwaltozyma polyspora DSM 70294]